MSEGNVLAQDKGTLPTGQKSGLFGSLKDALVAAGRADRATTEATGDAGDDYALAAPLPLPPPLKNAPASPDGLADAQTMVVQGGAQMGLPSADAMRGPTPQTDAVTPVAPISAAEAARTARGEPSDLQTSPALQTGRAQRASAPSPKREAKALSDDAVPPETRLLRGRQKVERGGFSQDPVVGWLVIVGGPGIGCYRPIFEGNNAIGRAPSQRIALDFGDDSISSEEQAFIRYDSTDRSFLFVPNLAKTNVVSLNEKRPTSAVELRQMDVIVIGRTQLVFVPFCGGDFDWSELANPKS
ncbi:MAG: FHA domain-containing protein [Pseudomonadota bacterium]